MKTIWMLIVVAAISNAQVEIFGLRTYANNDEYRPPIIARGESITIEFDVATSLPPNLQVIFRHASKEWIVDDNVFVNEPANVRSEILLYSAAPAGIYQYKYRFVNSFPNSKNQVAFKYSGNYIYTIVDHDANDQVVGKGRFIVGESSVPVTLSIENKYHSEYAAPFNQMNFISVDVVLPAEFTAADLDGIYHPDVKTVEVIKNWDFYHSNRIDQEDNNPETFVENVTKPSKTFWKRDVSPGNEYRRLDLSSAAFYPNNRMVILRDHPDVSRFQWQGKPDANGASKIKAFSGANGDYLEVELRLRLPNVPEKRVFVTGGFTEWNVRSEFELKPDSVSGMFTTRFWVRRGVYDYQYVLGNINPDGIVIDQDWIALEGNDWRTINRYTALVYYHDQRFGGFDRVIGYVRGRNPGGREPGKSSSTMHPQPKSGSAPVIWEKGKK